MNKNIISDFLYLIFVPVRETKINVGEIIRPIKKTAIFQGREFALSLFRSKSLILKSNCEQFALVAL